LHRRIDKRSDAQLGAGIIGLGVGERHAAGFESHPDCRVVALCDVDPAKRAVARERWPDARIYDRAESLIADAGVHIVSIASYDDAHYRQLCHTIDAGKHAFVEKPICTTDEELADLRVRLARRPDLHVSSNLILRKAPRFADLKARVERGALGRLYFLEGDYDYGRLHKLDGTWRGATPGYSVVLGGAVHLVDLLLWLMAGRTPVEAMAMGNRISSAEARIPFAPNDLVVALVRFDDGAVAKISARFAPSSGMVRNPPLILSTPACLTEVCSVNLLAHRSLTTCTFASCLLEGGRNGSMRCCSTGRRAGWVPSFPSRDFRSE
jgi:predicted dehydrogenase